MCLVFQQPNLMESGDSVGVLSPRWGLPFFKGEVEGGMGEGTELEGAGRKEGLILLF